MSNPYNTFISHLINDDIDENIITSIAVIMNSRFPELKRLLNRPNSTLGTTPLGYAVLGKRESVAIALVESGYVDPNIYIHCGHMGNLPILTAACHWRMENLAITLLNRPNTDPSLVGSYSTTALMEATRNNLEEVVYFLLLRGDCAIDHANFMGRNALYFANISENRRIITALLETGEFDPDHLDNSSTSAFTDACISASHAQWIPLLYMDYNMDTPRNITDDGLTPLILACNQTNIHLARQLLATNESLPGHSDNQGETALIQCCSHSSTEMLDLGLEIFRFGRNDPRQDSNPTQVNLDGHSALTIILANASHSTLITPEWSPANSDMFRELLQYYLEFAPADAHFTTIAIPMMCSNPVIRSEVLKSVSRVPGLNFDVPEQCQEPEEAVATYHRAQKGTYVRSFHRRPSRIRSLSGLTPSQPSSFRQSPVLSRTKRRAKSLSPYRRRTHRDNSRRLIRNDSAASFAPMATMNAQLQPDLAHGWAEDIPEYYRGLDGQMHPIATAVSDNRPGGIPIQSIFKRGGSKKRRLHYSRKTIKK